MQLLLEGLGHIVGPVLPLGSLAQGVYVLAGASHAQLLLDGLQLVVEVVLPLLLIHLHLYLLLDVLAYLEDLYLLVQQCQKQGGAPLDVALFQKGDLLKRILHIDGGRHEIHQKGVVFNVADGKTRLLRNIVGELDDAQGGALDAVHKRIHVRVCHRRVVFRQIFDGRHHVGRKDIHRFDVEAADALDNGSDRHVWQIDYFDDPAERAGGK